MRWAVRARGWNVGTEGCEAREASLLAGSSVGVERKRRSIHVPKSSLRSPSFAGRRGWAKRRVGHGLFRRWKREYLSLWGDCMLYFHKDKDGSDMFLSGKDSNGGDDLGDSVALGVGSSLT